MPTRPGTAEARLSITRDLPYPPEAVFAAWIDPEGLRVWMCPFSITHTEALIDARVGGRFVLVMHEPGCAYEHTGEYLAIDRPGRLQLTWVSKGTEMMESLVTITLADRSGGTRLELAHERLPHDRAAAGHEAGWNEILDKLTDYLSR